MVAAGSIQVLLGMATILETTTIGTTTTLVEKEKEKVAKVFSSTLHPHTHKLRCTNNNVDCCKKLVTTALAQRATLLIILVPSALLLTHANSGKYANIQYPKSKVQLNTKDATLLP